MNTKSLKQLGLFLVCCLLLFVGCKRPSESLGEGIQPDEDLLFAAVTDSFALKMYTERIDSFRTDLFANVLVGNYVDEDFGAVKCRGVFQLAPDLSADTLPENLEVFAVELKLAYQPEAYGNNTPMYFQVQRLQQRLYRDSAYYTNNLPQRDLENQILSGHETHVTRSEYASALSTGAVEYLTLPLKTTLGQYLLASDSALTNFDAFSDYFPGLIISSTTMDGRVVSFATINTSLIIYYRYSGQNRMNIGTYTFKYTSACEAYSVIEHQRFGSPLQPLTSDTSLLSDHVAYLQGSGGTRVRVDLSDVLWMRELPNPIINKAELVVPFDAETKLDVLDSVNVVYEKSEGLYALTADYARNAGGNFRKAPGYYRFNITTHVQSLLAGEISTTELLLVANPRVAGLYNTMVTRRSLLRGPLFDEDNTRNTRLVITYSY